MSFEQTLRTYHDLNVGDRAEVLHEVKVGFRKWTCRTVGEVVQKERRRHSLHYDRNNDDKVFSDTLVLKLPSGELTTVTLDEYSTVTKLSPGDGAAAKP